MTPSRYSGQSHEMAKAHYADPRYQSAETYHAGRAMRRRSHMMRSQATRRPQRWRTMQGQATRQRNYITRRRATRRRRRTMQRQTIRQRSDITRSRATRRRRRTTQSRAISQSDEIRPHLWESWPWCVYHLLWNNFLHYFSFLLFALTHGLYRRMDVFPVLL